VKSAVGFGEESTQILHSADECKVVESRKV
jgi:hypothetical protein